MIRILFFAGMAEKAGCQEISIEAGGMTVGEIKAVILSKFPQLESDMADSLVAINETYSTDQRKAADGDIIALIPPVSGG